jgi:hypothetical protein
MQQSLVDVKLAQAPSAAGAAVRSTPSSPAGAYEIVPEESDE